jgi:hypothetical protein
MVSVSVGRRFTILRTFNDSADSFQKFTAVVNLWFAFAVPLPRGYTGNHTQLFRQEDVVAVLHFNFQMVVCEHLK